MRISDWSSDVCSSDLALSGVLSTLRPQIIHERKPFSCCGQSRVYNRHELNFSSKPLERCLESRLPAPKRLRTLRVLVDHWPRRWSEHSNPDLPHQYERVVYSRNRHSVVSLSDYEWVGSDERRIGKK